MAAQQRTFVLIPETLVETPGPVKAMTSKQAKKAYQKKNKGPKVSRVEQARLDWQELEAQKKEYEHERALKKAKAARDKKAQKAEEERAERKRKGLPEPSRHVRASQPRISMFVTNGNGKKRSWQQMATVGDESEDTNIDTTIECDEEPLAKRIAAEAPANESSDDEFGDFPSISQEQDLLEKLDSSALEESVLEPSSPQELPALRQNTSDGEDFGDDLDELATVQRLSEADAILKALSEPAPRENGEKNDRRDMVERDKDIKSPIHNISVSSLQVRSMAPKTLLRQTLNAPTTFFTTHKALTVTQPTSVLSATQAFLESHLDDFFPSPSQEVRELLKDLDDIPSNTQVAMEIETPARVEDDSWADMFSTQDLVLSPQDLLDIATPTRPSSKALLPRTSLAKPLPAYGYRCNRNSIPLAQPQLYCVNARLGVQPRVPSRLSHISIPSIPGTAGNSASPESAEKFKAFQVISEEVIALPQSDQDNDMAQVTPTKQSDKQFSTKIITKTPRRFFEEKDEDLLHAALQESKMAFVTRPKPSPTLPKVTRNAQYLGRAPVPHAVPVKVNTVCGNPRQRPASHTPYPSHQPRSTHVAEEASTAGQPSIIISTTPQPQRGVISPKQTMEDMPTKRAPGMPTPRETPKLSRLILGEMHSNTAAKQAATFTRPDIPVNETPKKTTKTFQRAQSTATDYGDDEFNEQELLAL
ncbi:hypothetical protein BJ878DRAFT_489974 [Calycina marina]|uniref:Uncharacterized protein n=1 Tax=Calycina marina TaxID=1763456 RepID=A0A9P7Z9Q6_9HELO|nr:hypothetical protein BJ878DRAFT_489974 [Calycina marina]